MLLMCCWLRMLLLELITIIPFTVLVIQPHLGSAGSLGHVQDVPQQDELRLRPQQSLRHSQRSVYEQQF